MVLWVNREDPEEVQMKNVLVVGSLNLDLVCQVKYHPKTGETIFGSDLKQYPGGKGANQAVAAASLGGRVQMLGSVGHDDSGKMLLENLRSSGVEVKDIKVSRDVATGTALISVNEEGDNSIIVIPGANNTADISYIRQNTNVIDSSDIVLLQMEIPMESVNYVVEEAYKRRKIIIVNPAPAQMISDEVLKMIDYLTPNESELELLSGRVCSTDEEVVSAAQVLRSKGVKNLIVTLGDKGALFMNSNETRFINGHKVKAVDTTAAGDCFNGAFAVALSEGKNVEDAIRFANKAASISVTRVGAQSSMPLREELV